MIKLFAFAAAVSSLAYSGTHRSLPGPSGSAGITYEPIPANFKIPAPAADLRRWLDFDPAVPVPPFAVPRMNVPALRRHAWNVFAGLTSPSRAQRKGTPGYLPIWETWYSVNEIFEGAGPKARSLKAEFEVPHLLLDARGERDPHVHVIANMRYNREARDFIFNQGLNQLASRRNEGDIPEFPRNAMALKTSWMHVSKDLCTAIPVWDFQPSNLWSPNNWMDSWPRKVFVEPVSGACSEHKEKTPLDRFYRFQILTPEDVKQITALDFKNVQIGDYLVLVGFHFTTKEIPNWVWGTVWWHDRPNDGPYALNRPASVKAPWNQYLMDVNYDMDRPWEPDATPKIIYNPYLEGMLVDGIHSNCMTCHRRATFENKANAENKPSDLETMASFGSELPITQIVVRGSEAATASYFPEYDRLLKLDFMWSLALHQPKPSPNVPPKP